MEDTGLLRRFWFAFRATVSCLVAPSRFAELARIYDAKAVIQNEQAAALIRHAFWGSCLLTFGSLVAGYLLGAVLRCCVGATSASVATLVQALSASTVLIATLAARGWDIQTFGGVSIAEKVNQWLTRSLFVLGTFFFSLFLGWSQ